VCTAVFKHWHLKEASEEAEQSWSSSREFHTDGTAVKKAREANWEETKTDILEKLPVIFLPCNATLLWYMLSSCVCLSFSHKLLFY